MAAADDLKDQFPVQIYHKDGLFQNIEYIQESCLGKVIVFFQLMGPRMPLQQLIDRLTAKIQVKKYRAAVQFAVQLQLWDHIDSEAFIRELISECLRKK